MTIERSTGTIVPNWGGPLPGGGYQGATEELDALVVEAANRLTAEYNRDVVIRFNSDRRSGGAWLRDHGTNDTLVGLNAGFRAIRPATMTMDEYIDTYLSLPQAIFIDTWTAYATLRDKSLATQSHYKPEVDRYAYVGHASIEAAMDWLRANVLPSVKADIPCGRVLANSKRLRSGRSCDLDIGHKGACASQYSRAGTAAHLRRYNAIDKDASV